MPLVKGKSKAAIAKNFHTEKMKHPDMPRKQVIAIVLTTAGIKKKKK